MNFRHSTFDALDGLDLGNGDLRFHSRFQSGFLQDEFRLKLTTDTLGFFTTYGVTDRVDISVAVPVIHADLSATLVTSVDATGIGKFDSPMVTFNRSDSASGIGDVFLRAKYNFLKRRSAESTKMKAQAGGDPRLASSNR